MHKEKTPQDARSLRGSSSNNTTVPQTAYSGKIPVKDFMALEKELFGMAHGTVSLTIAIRDGKLQYSRIIKEYTTRDCDE